MNQILYECIHLTFQKKLHLSLRDCQRETHINWKSNQIKSHDFSLGLYWEWQSLIQTTSCGLRDAELENLGERLIL